MSPESNHVGGAKKNPKPYEPTSQTLFSVQIVNFRETNDHLGITKVESSKKTPHATNAPELN